MQLLNRDHTIPFLNLILHSEVMIEEVEAMEGTVIYRQAIKQRANALKVECEKFTKDYLVKIWGIDDEALYPMLEQKKRLIGRLAISRPDIWAMVNELLDMYEESPEAFIARNEIQIVESSASRSQEGDTKTKVA